MHHKNQQSTVLNRVLQIAGERISCLKPSTAVHKYSNKHQDSFFQHWAMHLQEHVAIPKPMDAVLGTGAAALLLRPYLSSSIRNCRVMFETPAHTSAGLRKA